MKFSTAAVLAAGATLASAQSISSLVAEIPPCADACLVQYITQVCGSVTDYACQCMPANVATLTTDLTPCVLKACTTAEALKLQSLSSEICSVYSAEAGSSAAASTTVAASSASAASTVIVTSSVVPTSTAAVVDTTTVSSVVVVVPSSTMMSSSMMMSSSSMMMSSSMVDTTTAVVVATTAAVASSTMLESFTGAAGPMATAGPIGAILAAAVAFAL